MTTYYNYEEVISGGHPRQSKVIKASTRYEFDMKKSNQLAKWAEQEKREKARQHIENVKAQAQYDTEEAQKELSGYQGILEATLAVDDRLKWEPLYRKDSFPQRQPVFSFSEQAPTLEGIYKLLSVPKERPFWEGIFKRLKPARLEKEEKAKKAFEDALVQHQDRRKDAEKHHQQELERYQQRKEEFEEQKRLHNLSIDEFKAAFEAGQPEAIENYVRLVLEHSIYPDAVKKEFEVQFEPVSGTAIINYWFPSPIDIPRIVEHKYIVSKQIIQPVEMKQKDFNAFYESILLQIVLRTIHEVFESVYISAVSSAVFNGWVQGLDTKTGNDFTSCVISCQAARADFENINLARVLPKDCIRNLKGLIAGPLAQLAPVRPIMDINREDKRFIESHEVLANLNSSDNLAEMDWADFEHLVRELFTKIFAKDGAEVRVTQASRDGGVDAVAFDPDPIRGGKFVIQAKRFNNVVPVSAARDLYGTMINEGAVKGILVTTSYFGADSRDFVKDKPITLIDGANLVHLFQQYGHDVRIDLKSKQK